MSERPVRVIASRRIALRSMPWAEVCAVAAQDRSGRLWAADYPTEGDVLMASLADPAALPTPQAPWGLLQVAEHPSGLAIGGCGFLSAPDDAGVAEIGYGLCESRQGRGLGSEAVRLMLRLGRTHSLAAVTALTDPGNAASRRVLEKCGFSHVGKDVDGVQDAWRIDLVG